jgi:exopolyphosphatase / guanosine-5'-triphosphate,3'-diphosphate pyrophosphatase
MKLGVIDIGSNAIRFQVENVFLVDGEIRLKKMEFIRFPLRLGHDVFTTGKITLETEVKLLKLFESFKILFELFEIEHYLICATSAMREATNGGEIADRISKKLDMDVKIISGDEEAWLINRAIDQFIREHDVIHIDVGGGSTELNVFMNKEKVASNSFKIGTVRILEGKEKPESWEKMEDWVRKYKKKMNNPHAVGTGGNINKLSDLIPDTKYSVVSLKKLKKIISTIEGTSIEDRMFKMMMNPDRADVIVPAGKIFTSIMDWIGAGGILVPRVGLKDGMIWTLVDRYLEYAPLKKVLKGSIQAH